jgi:hypothetical protein
MVVQDLVQVYQTSTALARQVKSDHNIKLESLDLQIFAPMQPVPGFGAASSSKPLRGFVNRTRPA